MAYDRKIAKPYAHAAFAIAKATTTLTQWSDFLEVLGYVMQDRKLQQIVKNPEVGQKQLAEWLGSAGKEFQQQEFKNFLDLLAENRRLDYAKIIAEEFLKLRKKDEGKISVNVTSAREISPEDQQKIEKALERRYSKKVELTLQLNPQLIGGVVIRVGDQVFDGSLQNKLFKLQQQLCE